MRSTSQFFAKQVRECLDFLLIQAREEYSTNDGEERITKFMKQIGEETKEYRDVLVATGEGVKDEN